MSSTLKKRGDTLIEVTFAIAVFCLVSAITMMVMNSDLAAMQATMELTMARNEIDAQAEAIRFIHNNYNSERELVEDKRVYEKLWLKITRDESTVIGTSSGSGLVNSPNNLSRFYSTDCSKYYNFGNTTTTDGIHNIQLDHAFIINTRKIDPYNVAGTIMSAKKNPNKFKETTLYPRVIFESTTPSAGNTDDSLYETNMKLYNQVARAEGLWVIGVKQENKNEPGKAPQYFDFHIRACWYAPGRSTASTIATIIRLYNPEYIQEIK
jgi:type II secretory pathway pseudopilin PulG